jgi:hypothetical protein
MVPPELEIREKARAADACLRGGGLWIRLIE